MNAVQLLKQLQGKSITKVVIDNKWATTEQCVKSVIFIFSDNTQIKITDYHEEFSYHNDILVEEV